MICTRCAAKLEEDNLYCSQCGNPTGQAELATVGGAALPEISAGNTFKSAATPEPETSAVRLIAPSAKLLDRPERQALHTRLTQANLCRLRGQWTAAIDHCLAVLRAQPGDPSAHALLGDIYRDQGKTEDAIRWYRMAVELRPNPVDKAKLEQLEQERARREQIAEQRARRGYEPSAPSPLTANDSLPGGTTNLMGLSPQRWLRGLTVMSLAFLALVIFALIVLQSSRVRDTSIPRPLGTSNLAVTTLPSHGSILPPGQAGGAPMLPEGGPPPRSVSSPAVGGSGFPADHSASGHAAPRPQEKPSASTPPEPTPPPLPPAAVTAVRPLNHLPMPQAPTGAVGNGTPAPPTISVSTALTAGMHVAQVQNNPTAGSAAVLVLAPAGATPNTDSQFRTEMIRNVYRAANSVFTGNSGISRATVYIQTSVDAAAGKVLLVADVDRATAQRSNPDTDPVDSLEQHLLSARWGTEETPSAGKPADTQTSTAPTP